MDDVARAFVPGHVTGFYAVERDEDPTRAGATGAGVALTDGVEVTVEHATEPTVELNGEPVELGAVERVLDALSVGAAVRAETALPLGGGFGVTGAVALGTALAANHLFAADLSENELVTVAHGAEVQAGTGLADVVAQARGGVPVRLEPGGPHQGVLDGIPGRGRIEYVHLGDVGGEGGPNDGGGEGGPNDGGGEGGPNDGGGEGGPHGEGGGGAAGDPFDAEGATPVGDAGEQALSLVVQKPNVEQFMYASRRFAREAGLLEPAVADAIEAVIDVGGEAAMATGGRTVFATGRGLTEAGYDPSVCEVHVGGATLL